jgi:hypothetical protein
MHHPQDGGISAIQFYLRESGHSLAGAAVVGALGATHDARHLSFCARRRP